MSDLGPGNASNFSEIYVHLRYSSPPQAAESRGPS